MDTVMIGQGYNFDADTSVAKELIEQFESSRYEAFTCLVAFASFGGVSALTPYVLKEKQRGVKIRIILGVDQKCTSKEALEEVLSWKVDARIYHAQATNIFHPKIYLFENADIFTLIVGSNNLTEGGLVRNVECSLLVKDIKSNPVHQSFYKYWKSILDGSGDHVYKLTQKLIDQMIKEGIIVSEEEYARRNDGIRRGCGDSRNNPTIFKKAKIQKPPTGFRPKRLVKVRCVKNRTAKKLKIPIEDSVLIAEIGGGRRWKQVNFPVKIFEDFFGAQRGNNLYNIELQNIASDGLLGAPEVRQAVSVKSQNYRFEIRCAETERAYPGVLNRPIGLFVKVTESRFLYQVLLAEHPAYDSIKSYLQRESRISRAGELRRTIRDVEAIRALYPEFIV